MADITLKSPGIQVREIDFTGKNELQRGITTGAYVGAFEWGPGETVVRVSAEAGLIRQFGKPTENSALSFMSAANFLRYSNSLVVVRAINSNTYSGDYATASINSATKKKRATYLQTGAFSLANVLTASWVTSTNSNISVSLETPASTGGVNAAAYVASSQVNAGINVSGVTISSGGLGFTTAQFPLAVTLANTLNAAQNTTANLVLSDSIVGYIPLTIKNKTDFVDDFLYTEDASSGSISPAEYGEFAARYPSALGDSMFISICDGKQAWFANATGWQSMTTSNDSSWVYATEFDSWPETSDWAADNNVANDEMHIIVVDRDGLLSGVRYGILEKFQGVSKIKDAKINNGGSNYYRQVILENSSYIYSLAHPGSNTTNWGVTKASRPSVNVSCGFSDNVASYALANGQAGLIGDTQISAAYDILKDKVAVDISLLFTGDASTTTKQKAREVAMARKDCVAFVSPSLAAVKDPYNVTDAVLTESRNLAKSTYVVYDSGWKWQYDKYFDKYRWVPLNADIAGLCARTDRTRDPWFSPAGTDRGRIQNCIKLAYNPTQTQRDRLYRNAINPVVTFPGEGTILFGDKTFSMKDSAFSRINVRRLFLTIEKAIAKAARSSLFEFNDDFTRSQFVNLIDPFLRTIKGRRGIYDYQVVCDTTNNTPDVIDANQFIGDIYIKPARSINYIQLNFVAVRTGVEFSEVVGRI